MRLGEPSSEPLTVSLLAPNRERCGIGEYSRLLAEALDALPGIATVNRISTPEAATRIGTCGALQNYLPDERRFYALGESLNTGDVAHIQHQYFFFGGVAPHKNHFRALLNAVRVPLVLTVHEIASGGTSGWKRALIALTNRRNFLHPAIRQVVVHTQADACKLRTLGVPEAQLTVLPVAVPPTAPLPNRDTARAALRVDGKQVLLMFGFLSAKKGHFLALEALTHLPDDTILMFAGERHPHDCSDYVARLRASITERGLEERVLITGYLPDDSIPGVMAAADVALAPFTESSGSASLAHLLAYGVPVVASDIPPHRELLSQSPGSLLLFPNGNAASLAQAMQTLLNNRSVNASLKLAAGQYAAERSFAHLAGETLALYRKAIAG